jgi:excinuclease ABC subunit C
MRGVVANLPSTPGVYRFRDAHGRVLYVGRAVQLRRRVGSYWNGLGDRAHLAPMVRRIARVEALSCDSPHEAAWLERNLLEHARPRWNRTAGGQEVPVHIRLDARPAAPGLSVVHTVHSGQPFGPYLGGDRVRLAVSALERVLPLSYTGTGLSGAQRDMAATRGVCADDRDAMVATLTAVLRRDPAAVGTVLDRLARRRDAAAGALAFELAARIQAEIEAVEWVVAPQRVTATEPADFDACGWAAGILVRLHVRAGRLCAWTQRACPAPTARRYLDATPVGWAGYAGRNAELAARLAG